MTFPLSSHPERGSEATESKGLWVGGVVGLPGTVVPVAAACGGSFDFARLTARSAQNDEESEHPVGRRHLAEWAGYGEGSGIRMG